MQWVSISVTRKNLFGWPHGDKYYRAFNIFHYGV